MTARKLITKSDLRCFTGTENWYRHSLIRKVLYTDGVQYVAEHAGAYWLLDEIACTQLEPEVAEEPFQFWKLTVNLEKHNGDLTCTDGNGKVVHSKTLEFTDFPLDEICFYFVDNTILLTTEY